MSPSKAVVGKIAKHDKNRRRFKCGSCEKTFKRSEHCARHELMHTQERPFACRYCSKSYGRKDLVRRHERTLHADQWTDDHGQNNAQSSPSNPTESPGVDIYEREERIEEPGPRASQEQPGARSIHHELPNPDFNGLFPTSLQGLISPPIRTSPPGREASQDFTYDSNTARQLHNARGHNDIEVGPDQNLSLLRLLQGPNPELLVDYSLLDATISDLHTDRQEPIIQPQHTGNIPPAIGQTPSLNKHTTPPGVNGSVAGSNGRPDGLGFDDFNFSLSLGGSPVDAWSKEPSNLTLHLPKILQEQARIPPKIIISEECFQTIHNDVLTRLPYSALEPLLTAKELQQLINSYIECFHPHLPILHLPSFSISETASPFLLAMASIGALYRLRRRRAYALYELADKLISSDSYQGSDGPHRSALWLMQTKVLLALFATLSKNERLASDMFKKLGFFMLEYQWRRMEIQDTGANRNNMTWKEWIKFEETKRALCAMFIFSDLMLITFNMTPGFVIDRDLLIDAPDDEDLWTAQTAEQWEELRKSASRSSQRHTIQSIMERMVQVPQTEQNSTEPFQLSGFTALTIMHAVNVYLWHLNQFAVSIGRFSLGMWPHENLRTALLHAATSALDRCQAALLVGRSEECKFGWDDPANVMIFNCGAVLRSAYSRLLPPSHSFNRLTLLTDDQEVINKAVRTYASSRLERTVFVTKAAQKAYEGFQTPVTIGHLFVSKTAALHWSVEQAVVGWDSALLLTKWLHNLETDGADHPPNEDEQQIVNNLKRLLAEMEVEYDETQPRSLAAVLARSWACFLDDVWVWGITPRMGAILRLLAVQYEQRFESVHTSEPKESTVDVLIIGAGPAGYMAALWLARLGVNTRIIDKRSTRIFTGQADGLQPRVLEVFETFGFVDRALKEVSVGYEACYYEPDENGTIHHVETRPEGIPGLSRFNGSVVHQGRIETWLSEAISEFSDGALRVERPVLPVALDIETTPADGGSSSAYPVRVVLQKLPDDEAMPEQYGHKVQNGLYRQFEGDQERNGPSIHLEQEVVRAKYVIGCDGAHSWVRKQLDIEHRGDTSDFVWGVLDMLPITDFPDIRRRCSIHSKNEGSIMVIPRENGLVRLYIQLREVAHHDDEDVPSPTSAVGAGTTPEGKKNNRVDRSKVTAEQILTSAQKIFKPYTLDAAELHWFTAYQIGQRVATAFGKEDRVFIAGDACHTHSPKAGQGMNVSMMDTFNLAWKIAYVVKGMALPGILSTYESERRAVAEELIAYDRKLSRLFSSKPGEMSTDEFRGVIEKGLAFTTGCTVNYGPSALVDKPHPTQPEELYASPLAKGLAVGMRLPDVKVVMQCDGRPWWFNQRLLSTGHFRVVVFVGDYVEVEELRRQMSDVGEYLAQRDSYLQRLEPALQFMLVHASSRDKVKWDDFPVVFRPQDRRGVMDYWRVFADAPCAFDQTGEAYAKYGIDKRRGAAVVLRPDGYVAKVVEPTVEGIQDIGDWLGGFMQASI
ncbi:hypothetical protein FE257_003632 [Aspergillus nanangensis]|uniref:C2H2-type domain-containing protein n=1 Tax=Aspergillus nanangensis TaxID=2582783 RepID=A0AAD4CS79_ASPNN|nr:hypothetical protein FE257_003632 [Aspergillus nanangensis]